jgi:hypothetical protein
MSDPRGQLLRAAVGFATCSMPSYGRRTPCPPHVLGLGGPGLGEWRSAWLTRATTSNSPGTTSAAGRDVLHDGNGTLADERDGGTGWERTPWRALRTVSTLNR